MNIRTSLAGLAVAMAFGAPALAQDMNGGTITCVEYVEMDAAGKNLAMGAVRGFARESVNAAEAGTVAQTESLTDEEFMGRMDAACVEALPATTVISAMQ